MLDTEQSLKRIFETIQKEARELAIADAKYRKEIKEPVVPFYEGYVRYRRLLMDNLLLTAEGHSRELVFGPPGFEVDRMPTYSDEVLMFYRRDAERC